MHQKSEKIDASIMIQSSIIQPHDKWRKIMKNIIATLMMIILTATASLAQEAEVVQSEECSATSVALGIGSGVVAAAVVGVVVVATSPLVGPGVAAGTTVGLTGALSGPVLTGSTLMSVGASSIILGVPLGALGGYIGCGVDYLID
jgi:hypothetical protein